MSGKTIKAIEVVNALDKITGGRVLKPGSEPDPGLNPFVVEKSSGLPGKAVLETPGLVVGDTDKPVASLGIGMTLTESMIELAGSIGLDAIIVHHPVADAANSGGVPLKPYLKLYNLALFELHEAFHGLHPGIAYLHGHQVVESDFNFAAIPGNIIFYGRALPEIKTAKEIILRLNAFMNLQVEEKMLAAESEIRQATGTRETMLSARPKIMHGEADAPVKQLLHIFPHTGFTPQHLEMAIERYPQTDTIIVSISRILPQSKLLSTVREKGLTLLVGNSHAQEIYENGLPLAYALKHELPEVSMTMLRERVTATPLKQFGHREIQDYARRMAKYLSHANHD
jgi:hypothetical protein